MVSGLLWAVQAQCPQHCSVFQCGISKRFCSRAWSYPAAFILLSRSVFSYLAFLGLNSLSFGLKKAEFVVFFLCDDFMPCTTNNSLATTMLGATAKLFHHLGRTLCPQQGHPSYRTNISTSSDALAQAMSKALTDSLPGILAALHNHVIPSQPTPLNSNSTVISTLSPAPLTQASLGQATTTGTFIVPSFVSTFSTLSMPSYGFSSLPLPSGSGSQTAGGGVVSAFPAISVSSAAVGKDFVIGPGYSPIPHKLVTKITTGLFVELEFTIGSTRYHYMYITNCKWRRKWKLKFCGFDNNYSTVVLSTALNQNSFQFIKWFCAIKIPTGGRTYRATNCWLFRPLVNTQVRHGLTTTWPSVRMRRHQALPIGQNEFGSLQFSFANSSSPVYSPDDSNLGNDK